MNAAFHPLEHVAAAVKAMGLQRKTPCVKSGYYMDCDSPDRISRITAIIHGKPVFTDLAVFVTSEELGY